MARAAELDDDLPDDVCPGCGGDISGWPNFECHTTYDSGFVHLSNDKQMLPRAELGTQGGCPWTRDMLVARAMRRRIAQGLPL